FYEDWNNVKKIMERYCRQWLPPSLTTPQNGWKDRVFQKHHSEKNNAENRLLKVKAQVDEFQGIMVENIDLVLQGEDVNLLLEQAENLVKNLAQSKGKKHTKRNIMLFIVVIVSYIILSLGCGGLSA
uniref:V-SNARE coiled-coil homology domain-containing protein n=1 Tax=Leptobrachium leishanense TaxID=445787 RepID=A0A8C5PBP4_9ANUR